MAVTVSSFSRPGNMPGSRNATGRPWRLANYRKRTSPQYGTPRRRQKPRITMRSSTVPQFEPAGTGAGFGDPVFLFMEARTRVRARLGNGAGPLARLDAWLSKRV